jgi:hypothetical protein
MLSARSLETNLLQEVSMPGGLISKKQQEFLDDLFRHDSLVLSTKRSDTCSVNIHGKFSIVSKTWGDGMAPAQEHLLGLQGKETDTGEPLAHFHVTWPDILWAKIEFQPNGRIKTMYRIRLCRERDNATEEIYFYARESPVISELKKKWPPDADGWIALQNGGKTP